MRNFIGEINYKQLHNMLLQRKKELDTFGEQDSPEYREIQNMIISVRNMYRIKNNIPFNWNFGEPNPIINRKGWEKFQKQRRKLRT